MAKNGEIGDDGEIEVEYEKAQLTSTATYDSCGHDMAW
jgi:hypothetical protein